MTMIMTNNDDKIEKTVREYEKYAKKNGFSLNPNRKAAEGIVKGLLGREKNLELDTVPAGA